MVRADIISKLKMKVQFLIMSNFTLLLMMISVGNQTPQKGKKAFSRIVYVAR